MRRIHRIFLTVVLFLPAVPMVRLLAWKISVTPVAVMEQITPEAAMPGETVTVTGYGLEASNVRQVYLICGKTEYLAAILEQTNTALRFRVPTNVPTGPVRLAAMLSGRAELMEQPVVLMVLEGMMTEERGTPGR